MIGKATVSLTSQREVETVTCDAPLCREVWTRDMFKLPEGWALIERVGRELHLCPRHADELMLRLGHRTCHAHTEVGEFCVNCRQ